MRRFYRSLKYHNKPTYVNGIRFASRKEAERYRILKLAEKQGQIKKLELQPKFDFPMRFSYKADFRYWLVKEGKWIIEDVKGIETAIFKLKEKCFKYFYPFFELKIVR